jgi:hypothetical protein
MAVHSYCGSVYSPEVLLCCKPNDTTPYEFSAWVSSTRTALNGLSISMRGAAERFVIALVDVLAGPKRCNVDVMFCAQYEIVTKLLKYLTDFSDVYIYGCKCS